MPALQAPSLVLTPDAGSSRCLGASATLVSSLEPPSGVMLLSPGSARAQQRPKGALERTRSLQLGLTRSLVQPLATAISLGAR
jgi:hypothetical protein